MACSHSVQLNQSQLIQACAEILLRHEDGLSEFDLLKRLQQEPYQLFDPTELQHNLALFQCHFVLFNALYQLRGQWLSECKGMLDIHSLQIVLKPYHPGTDTVAQEDKLQEYYLDWNQFHHTDEQAVEALLDSFWLRMGGLKSKPMPSEQELKQAYSLLEIHPNEIVNRFILKRQYRRLQHRHHPDKGGDGEQSKQLERAYQLVLGTLTD